MCSLPFTTLNNTRVASWPFRSLPSFTASSLTMTALPSDCLTSVLSAMFESNSKVDMKLRFLMMRSKASVFPYFDAMRAHWSNPATTRLKTASSVADMNT